ncbi:uncharacterized protein LTR77_008339 [Saxophila tyrrhenica]|uniref:DUF3669 domain-containing protein n=1 Tax=Saxophila tyrrhenica TaxID=1690608 RepID=A0AAV9P4S4_9PEZI|nr:hypothetical protein LTR77_008339 [Saxophila tyrrhenica]
MAPQPPTLSDRRLENRSSEMSVMSGTTAKMALLNLDLEDKLAEEARKQGDLQSQLKYMLSFKSAISTASSTAQGNEAAVHEMEKHREIGTGSIGKVFEFTGTSMYFKLQLTDSQETREKLANNYKLQLKIGEAFDRIAKISKMELGVQVPRAHWIATPDDKSFWEPNLDRFEWSKEFPKQSRDVLCMERIFPMPQPVRSAIIDYFCQWEIRQAAKDDLANRDCMVQPFLGRKRHGNQGSKLKSFSLRNFKLHINDLQKLGLAPTEWAEAMAEGMAILHCSAMVDGNDIEFVIGSSPTPQQSVRHAPRYADVQKLEAGESTFKLATSSGQDFRHRINSLWLLDFDACKDIPMDQSGVDAALAAFLQLYQCPRPHTDDSRLEEMWKAFAVRYRAVASTCGQREFGRRFLEAVEAAVEKMNQEKQERDKRSMPPPSGRSGGTADPFQRQRERGFGEPQSARNSPIRRGRDGSGQGSSGSSRRGFGYSNRRSGGGGSSDSGRALSSSNWRERS